MELSAGKKGFPVWIGDLHFDVNEKELKQRFSGFGSIVSCHIKNDKHGRKKSSAYVNFTNQESAEKAARKLAGYFFNGKPIKTKGPRQLRSEGYLKAPVDFRPFTDCTFFVEDKVCKNGENVSLKLPRINSFSVTFLNTCSFVISAWFYCAKISLASGERKYYA